ncbi:MAG: hypothetical protein FJ087_04355 [Deltaproteobacteria bacterium]|nr:hypothetical protein [Deltaproteobacteria bacterium]
MDAASLRRILDSLPAARVAVVGDVGLDTYWLVDPSIRDRSVETGLPIRQVVAVRSAPGGSGTVLCNARGLGVGRVTAIGAVGTDGAGREAVALLEAVGIDACRVARLPGRITPQYVRPLVRDGEAWREEERFDLFPREPLPADAEAAVARAVEETDADVLVVSDYGEAGKSGVVTPAVREAVGRVAARGTRVVASSRLNLAAFRGAAIAANEVEAAQLLGPGAWPGSDSPDLGPRASRLAALLGAPVFVTLGPRGVIVAEPGRWERVPALVGPGEADPVGAGDAFLAAVAGALAVRATPRDAALLGVLTASVTVLTIGATGVASPDAVEALYADHARRHPGAGPAGVEVVP